MKKTRPILLAAALLASGAVLIAAAPVEAREHGRIVHAHGPNGGYVAGRHVSRQPGVTQVRRGVLTHDGYGYRQTRTTTRADGAIDTSVERRYANGAQTSRTSSVARNPDGSVSTARARSGPGGASQASWSTIYRTDDGYTRTRSAETSTGRGYAATRDVSVGADSITVNRNAATNSGRTVSSTRTYQRPN